MAQVGSHSVIFDGSVIAATRYDVVGTDLAVECSNPADADGATWFVVHTPRRTPVLMRFHEAIVAASDEARAARREHPMLLSDEVAKAVAEATKMVENMPTEPSTSHDKPFNLKIVRSHGNTAVYDEDGELLFSLPGMHIASFCTSVERIRRRAGENGERWGRASMASDLRRLLDVPQREDGS